MAFPGSHSKDLDYPGSQPRASGWAKLAFVLMVIAVALQAAGLGTDSWMVSDTLIGQELISIGLFKARSCISSTCSQIDIPSGYETTAFTATKALVGVALGLMVITALMLLFYVTSKRFRKKSLGLTVMIMSYIAAGFAIIAMIVWVTQIASPFYASWSMGLSVFASALAAVAGVMLIPDISRDDYHGTLKVTPRPSARDPSPRRGYRDRGHYQDRDDYRDTGRNKNKGNDIYDKRSRFDRINTPRSVTPVKGFNRSGLSPNKSWGKMPAGLDNY